jgi:hypothetical protein
MTNTPEIVKTETILQSATFNSGPRIGKVQYVRVGSTTNIVEFWYNNDGTIHHISNRVAA